MMDLLSNPVFEEDLKRIWALPVMEELRGRTVLVTGATGLIGQTLVLALLGYGQEEDHKDRIRVIACVRNEDKARRLFAGADRGNLELMVTDIRSMPAEPLDRPVDYVIHAASQTSSKAFVDQPVETIVTAFDGTRRALEFAWKNRVRRFVYLSTMEVYGAPEDDHKIDERHGTDLDTMQARTSYPESKRLCEALCASWQKEYGVPVCVLRLTQTLGPGVRYDDGRVFAEFARCAMEGRDIILKTAGATCRSYLYTADAAAAILTAMVRGEAGQAYNAANEETYCSIRQMAQMVAEECAGGRIHVQVRAEEDPSKLGFAPTLHMNLDTSKLRALGWEPGCGLAEAYRRMMSVMQACNGAGNGQSVT